MPKRKRNIPRKFRCTRGRPPHADRLQAQCDLGTPELILKRACNQTVEAIDLCLQRGIITEEQHRAALHLRWLHTVRYGAPGISALNIARGAGRELPKAEDGQWRREREREYFIAISTLKERIDSATIISCAIYNEYPYFLKLCTSDLRLSQSNAVHRKLTESARFSEGLQQLVELWRLGHIRH